VKEAARRAKLGKDYEVRIVEPELSFTEQLLLNMRTAIARWRARPAWAGAAPVPAWWRASRRSLRPCSVKCACGRDLPKCLAGRSRTVFAPSSDGLSRPRGEREGSLPMRAALAAAILCSLMAAAPAMAELRVHVNRVALEAGGPKSALIESDKAGASGEFTILRDGQPVLSAPLVAQPDLAEWGASKHYYLADFSRLTDPGRYRVRVRIGEERAQSTEIVVARMRCSKSRPQR